MSRIRGWAWLAACLGLACLGCNDTACKQVALLLRECCAKGPPELRQGCEAEAERLENDGNSDACEAKLEQGNYEGCR